MTTSILLTQALACAASAAACGALNVLSGDWFKRAAALNFMLAGVALAALSAVFDSAVLFGAAAAPVACASAAWSMGALRGAAGVTAVMHSASASSLGPAFEEGVQVAASCLDMERARDAVRAYWDRRASEGSEAAKAIDDKEQAAARVVLQCAYEFNLDCERRRREGGR